MGNSQRKKSGKKVNRQEDRGSEILDEKVDESRRLDTKELTDNFVIIAAERQVNLDIAAKHLYKFLTFAFGEVTQEDITKKLGEFGNVVTFLEGEYIVRAGEESQGIFIILDGSVDVLVTDNSLVIGSLSTGDIFGEISTMFGVNCTANIQVKSDVTAVVIEPERAFELFDDHVESLDIIDWCVKNRYFPLGKEIDTTRTYRRMTLHFLRQVPAFALWEAAHVKNMIMSINRGLVTLYPLRATLVSAGDDIRSLFVVIRGTIRITSKGSFSKDITICRHTNHFIYGHFCMGLVTHKSSVTIQAITNCQVIDVEIWTILGAANRDNIPKIQEGPRKFASFKKHLPHAKQNSPGYFEYDVLYYYLRSSEMYKDASVIDIENKVLHSDCEIYKNDNIVVLAVEREKYEAVLVLRGTLYLQQAVKPTELVENRSDSGDKTTKSKSSMDTVVFDEQSIIDISLLDFSEVCLKSQGESFVCRIPKNTTDVSDISGDDVGDNKMFAGTTDDVSNSVDKLSIEIPDAEKITDCLSRDGNEKDVEQPKTKNGIRSCDTDKQISELNSERQIVEKEQAVEKVEKEMCKVDVSSNINVEEVKQRQSSDALDKLNERIKKGDAIDKPKQKGNKRKTKKAKKINELEFV